MAQQRSDLLLSISRSPRCIQEPPTCHSRPLLKREIKMETNVKGTRFSKTLPKLRNCLIKVYIVENFLFKIVCVKTNAKTMTKHVENTFKEQSLRHLIRVTREHDVTNKKTKTKTIGHWIAFAILVVGCCFAQSIHNEAGRFYGIILALTLLVKWFLNDQRGKQGTFSGNFLLVCSDTSDTVGQLGREDHAANSAPFSCLTKL